MRHYLNWKKKDSSDEVAIARVVEFFACGCRHVLKSWLARLRIYISGVLDLFPDRIVGIFSLLFSCRLPCFWYIVDQVLGELREYRVSFMKGFFRYNFPRFFHSPPGLCMSRVHVFRFHFDILFSTLISSFPAWLFWKQKEKCCHAVK